MHRCGLDSQNGCRSPGRLMCDLCVCFCINFLLELLSGNIQGCGMLPSCHSAAVQYSAPSLTLGMFSGASAIVSKECWPAREKPILPETCRLSSSVIGLFRPVSELLSDPASPCKLYEFSIYFDLVLNHLSPEHHPDHPGKQADCGYNRNHSDNVNRGAGDVFQHF